MSELKEMCKSLRLAHVAEIYEKIPFENATQFINALLSKELALREIVRVEKLIKKARFLQEKSLSAFEWHDQIHLPPHLDVEGLTRLDFIKRKENLILTGSPGTGNYRKFLFMESFP